MADQGPREGQIAPPDALLHNAHAIENGDRYHTILAADLQGEKGGREPEPAKVSFAIKSGFEKRGVPCVPARDEANTDRGGAVCRK